jgi:vesicle coat complex subunit
VVNTVGSNQQNRDESNQPQSANLPESIAKDLASPDPRTRYRALDHWETNDSKVSKTPLDPVFEAMEDEDPAVRAKATAIIEQHWAAEQERERG